MPGSRLAGMLFVVLLFPDFGSTCRLTSSNLLICSNLDDLPKFPDPGSIFSIVVADQNATSLNSRHLNVFTRLINFTMVNGSLQHVAPFAFVANPYLAMVNLSLNNKLEKISWQALVNGDRLSFANMEVDLTGNPLNCNCSNEWLTRPELYNVVKQFVWRPADLFHLPRHISHRPLDHCHFEQHCTPRLQLRMRPQEITVANLGDAFNLTCRLSSTVDQEPFYSEQYPVFEWIRFRNNSGQPEFLSIVRGSEFELTAKAAVDHLGFLTCKCWYCYLPLIDIIPVKVPVPLRITAISGTKMDGQLSITGWPLTNLNMSVSRLEPNIKEDPTTLSDTITDDTKVTFFNGSLVFKQNSHLSTFNRHIYKIFTQSCAICTRIGGNFSVSVCGVSGCDRAEFVLRHVTSDVITYPIIPTRQNDTSKAILLALIGVFAAITGVGFFCAMKRRHLIKRTWLRGGTGSEEENISLPTLEESSCPSSYVMRHVPAIEKDTITLREKIGQGAFGEVFSANWLGAKNRVAVKMLKNVGVTAELDTEAAVLARLDHPNVVRLFGMCQDKAQILLVFELMSLGDLKSYLKRRAPNPTAFYSQFPAALAGSELLNISCQITAGLAFLTDQHVIHRDLAARNCLVNGESDEQVFLIERRPPITVKISDFGMSRRVYADYYRMQEQKTMLPVRWLPPEALLNCRFTHQSDIWALGVTIWEVYSYGEVPFGDLTNSEILNAACNGHRPSKSPVCPDQIYALMEQCWERDPDDRIRVDDMLMALQAFADGGR